jgi:Prokaryotic membrane lipoprotein lipid attachment site
MRRSLLLLCLIAVLSGCPDINGAVQRAVVGVDCRHLLPDGQCAPVKKGP